VEARRFSLIFTKCYLELAGFGTNLESCQICHQPANILGSVYNLDQTIIDQSSASFWPENTNWFWDPHTGGIFCPKCQSYSASTATILPHPLLKTLLKIKAQSKKAEISEEHLFYAEDYFQRMANLQAGRTFKSLTVLKTLLREKGSEKKNWLKNSPQAA
jgi:recombinational DNA repair protein (RecF pathway)